MIFVRKRVLACLINSIKSLFRTLHISGLKSVSRYPLSRIHAGFYVETACIGQRPFITNSHSGLSYT